MTPSIQQLEQETNTTIPNSYQQVLHSFENILLIETANGDEVDFLSLQKLFQPYDKQHKRYQMVQVFMEDYFQRIQTTTLFNRDTATEIEGKDFFNNLYFASLGDDSALFFHLKDWSIWEFWHDDKSIAKLANSLDEFLENSENIVKDDWSKFLNE
ncbi:SMI1/KNR4 family protein [Sphingobacterium bovistauri]|uniref:SMI1/KNR4 family protein n=1 Tax=Sphingobacterium bovistauri TaxID=2781959 RepID=A0ABS7Z4Y4_9SPHI|nr:SMI1/KNR4 family protein [Sphingobacterium bovistauri]MCA5005233.1 SMI1/KNR4 family protein [Sphingobacterium bovistauri]